MIWESNPLKNFKFLSSGIYNQITSLNWLGSNNGGGGIIMVGAIYLFFFGSQSRSTSMINQSIKASYFYYKLCGTQSFLAAQTFRQFETLIF